MEDSSKLIQLIKNQGWELYKIPNGTAPIFEEMQKEGPVKDLEIGEHTYFFVPIPMKNQTLREAYNLTKGLGPSIIISPTYIGLLDFYKGSFTCERENEILFTRLSLKEDNKTILMTPKTYYNSDPSGVLLDTRCLFDIFQNNFRIVKPGEYNKTIPVPDIEKIINN